MNPLSKHPLENIFSLARDESRCAFIPYIMAGDPDLETSVQLIDALTEAGADAIELGVPYADPLADGPTIAAAGMRALANGVSLEQVLALASAAYDRGTAPIILFCYYNLIYKFGIQRFAAAAKRVGVAGVIVPDVIPEEAHEVHAALATHAIAMPLLVAPTTPRDRAAKIAAQSTGFVYVVSRLGVTGGAAAPDFSPLRAQITALRECTEKPLAVGFGVSSPEHVREVARYVDGIIVGSALIDAYCGSRGEEASRLARAFVQSLSLRAK